MTRQDHQYVNLPKSLMEVVDSCVTNIFTNGTQVYKNKKDFIIKAVVQQIENEKSINRKLQKLISQQEQELLLLQQQPKRGNRSKNV
jgi:hypothetical protein